MRAERFFRGRWTKATDDVEDFDFYTSAITKNGRVVANAYVKIIRGEMLDRYEGWITVAVNDGKILKIREEVLRVQVYDMTKLLSLLESVYDNEDYEGFLLGGSVSRY